MDIADITVEDLKRTVADACPTYYTSRDAKALLRKLYSLADADGIGNPRLPSYINLPKLNEKKGKHFPKNSLPLCGHPMTMETQTQVISC